MTLKPKQLSPLDETIEDSVVTEQVEVIPEVIVVDEPVQTVVQPEVKLPKEIIPKPVISNLPIVALNGIKHSVTTKFNLTFEEISIFAEKEGLTFPNLSDLTNILSQISSPKGNYFSSTTFTDGALTLAHGLSSNGKSVDLYTYKPANALLLRKL
jgi:hypothetical protein